MIRADVTKKYTFQGHRDCIYGLCALDATRFLAASGDGMVVGWDLLKPDQGEVFCQVSASVYALAYDKSAETIWVGENFSGVHLLDLTNKKEMRYLTFTTAAIFDIQICRSHVWVVDGNGKAYVFSALNQTLLWEGKLAENSCRRISYNFISDEVAIATSDGTIVVLDNETFQIKKQWKAHEQSVFALHFSPMGQIVWSGSRDAHLKSWNVMENYQPALDIPAHMFAINDMCYHPSQDFFATGSMDKSVKIWHASTGSLVKVIDKARHAGHGTSVNSVLWMPHEDLLVSAGDDRNISVWELKFWES